MVEIVGLTDARVAAYIRLMDKMFRLGRLLKNPNIPFEGMEDTIIDAINYLTYIYALQLEHEQVRR